MRFGIDLAPLYFQKAEGRGEVDFVWEPIAAPGLNPASLRRLQSVYVLTVVGLAIN